jgi:hypothetical protein
MKPMLEPIAEPHRRRITSFGTPYVAFRSPSHPSATFDESNAAVFLPLSDRGQSSSRANEIEAPAPGPVGGTRGDHFDDANREWFQWRFGEDA